MYFSLCCRFTEQTALQPFTMFNSSFYPGSYKRAFTKLCRRLSRESAEWQTHRQTGPILYPRPRASTAQGRIQGQETPPVSGQYIVVCQRGGVSNEPPWLQAAPRYGPGIICFTKSGWAWHATILRDWIRGQIGTKGAKLPRNILIRPHPT